MKKLFILLSFTASLFAMEPDIQPANADSAGITLKILDNTQKNKEKDTDPSIVYITPEDLQLLQHTSKTIRDVTEDFDSDGIHLPNINKEAFELFQKYTSLLLDGNDKTGSLGTQLKLEQPENLITLLHLFDYLNVRISPQATYFYDIIAKKIKHQETHWLLNKHKFQLLKQLPKDYQYNIAKQLITSHDKMFAYFLRKIECDHYKKKPSQFNTPQYKEIPFIQPKKPKNDSTEQLETNQEIPSLLTLAAQALAKSDEDTSKVANALTSESMLEEEIEKQYYVAGKLFAKRIPKCVRQQFDNDAKSLQVVEWKDKIFLFDKKSGNILRSFPARSVCKMRIRPCFKKNAIVEIATHSTHSYDTKGYWVGPMGREKYVESKTVTTHSYDIWYLKPLYQMQEYIEKLNLFQKLFLITAYTFAQKKTPLKIKKDSPLYDIYKSLHTNQTMRTILLKDMTVKPPVFNPVSHFWKLYIAKKD